MPLSYDNYNSINQGLRKLAYGEFMPWTEVSVLLDQVDKTGYWEQTANSFTEWLKSNAKNLGNKESTLWRYLVVGRYYHDLRKQFKRVKLEYPPLQELPKHVSPEKLELLSKLGRVAPKDFFEKLIYEVLNNEITRDEIREQWQAFRPALQGKTARGRGALIPSVNFKNEGEYRSVREALIINALKANGPSWLGSPNAQMYEVRMRVKIDTEASKKVLDAVILYKSDKNSDLEVHIIITVAALFIRKSVEDRFDTFAKYCDYLWIAASNDPKDMVSRNLLKSSYPDYVGIIIVADANVSVVRRAKPCKKDYVKANELLKVLLQKETR